MSKVRYPGQAGLLDVEPTCAMYEFLGPITPISTSDAATRMRDRCVEKVKDRRDKFQAAADSSSLPNDLTASRDAAIAAELTRLLGELQSLTLEQEGAGQ